MEERRKPPQFEKPNLVAIGIGLLFAGAASFSYFTYVARMDADRAPKAYEESATQESPPPPSDLTPSKRALPPRVKPATIPTERIIPPISEDLETTVPAGNEEIARFGEKLRKVLKAKAENFVAADEKSLLNSELEERRKEFDAYASTKSASVLQQMLLKDPISRQGFYSTSFHFTLQQIKKYCPHLLRKQKLSAFNKISLANAPYVEIVVTADEPPGVVYWQATKVNIEQKGSAVSISGIGEIRVTTSKLDSMNFANCNAIVYGVKGDSLAVDATHSNLMITGAVSRAELMASKNSIINTRNLELNSASLKASESSALVRAKKSVEISARDHSVVVIVKGSAAVKIDQKNSVVEESGDSTLGLLNDDSIRSQKANPLK